MTAPSVHRGAGLMEVPELLLRQVLLEGLVELAGDEPRMDELFSRVDGLLQNTAADWLDGFKAALQSMIPGGDHQVLVRVGYPWELAQLPCVSIIAESGSENQGEATIGDVLGRQYEVIGTPEAENPRSSRTIRHTVRGIAWNTNLQIGSWTTAPEMATVLHAIVRHLVFFHKLRLNEAGVLNVSLSETGFTPSESNLFPNVPYVPVLRCGLEWTFRVTRRTGPVPTRATVNPGSFTNDPEDL